MPRPDPIPGAEEAQRAAAWKRYKRLMRWMALLAAGASVLAVIYLKMTVGTVPIHMLIATIAGVSMSVLLGTALMGLVFLSNASGHDEPATTRPDDDRR